MDDIRDDEIGRKLTTEEIQLECALDGDQFWPNGPNENLPYLAICLAGEAGEFCNRLKKVLRTGSEVSAEDRADLIEELTDVFVYTTQLFNALKANMGDSYDLKRAINVRRFGTASDGTLRAVREPESGEDAAGS
jgi:NTP pyrophosphatase (non-canonical NTP hydrolase)